MSETVYRIVRQEPDGDWKVMVSAKGKSTYKTRGSARGARTQYLQDYWNRRTVLKIQSTTVNWVDVDDSE